MLQSVTSVLVWVYTQCSRSTSVTVKQLG